MPSALLLVLAPLVVQPLVPGGAVDVDRCDRPRVVEVQPGDDLQRALDHAGKGATVCFTRGTYRLTRPLRPWANQTLVGRGAVLTGSTVLHGFRRTAHGWTVSGQEQQGDRNGECARGTACTFPDDVCRDGTRLERVLAADLLRRGTFFFDYRRDEITVYDDPSGPVLEAMLAPTGILSRAGRDGVTATGFVVQQMASRAQHGAIETTASDWRIIDNTVQVNHGAGITSTGHVRIAGNTVRDNGQLGIGGTGESTYVVGNEIAGNNTAGFDPGWEAGGHLPRDQCGRGHP